MLAGLWSLPSRILTAILALCTMLALTIFWPRFLVNVTSPDSDPTRAWAAKFTIVNNGFSNLEDVRPIIGVCQLSGGRGAFSDGPSQFFHCDGPANSFIKYVGWHARMVRRDEPYDFYLESAFNFPGGLGYADMTIRVVYRVWFLPFELEKEFRFRFNSSGATHNQWISVPLYEN